MNGSSSVALCDELSCGKIIFKAIKNRITPPVAVSAGSEICNADKNACPENKKITITNSAMNSSRMITLNLLAGVTLLSAVKNNGILPRGSITKKSNNAAEIKVMVSVRSRCLCEYGDPIN